MPTPTSTAIQLQLSTAPSPRTKIPVAAARLPISEAPVLRRTTNAAISIFRTPTLRPEHEDALLTGGTRSLQRRLLALNLGYIPRMNTSTLPSAKVA